MNRILIIVCLLFSLIVTAEAGGLYSCIDQDGKAIVTTTPQDGMRDCVLKDSQENFTDRETYEKSKVSQRSAEREAREENYRKRRQKEECVSECSDAQQSCFKTCDEDYKKNYSGRNFCRRGCADTYNSCKSNRCN